MDNIDSVSIDIAEPDSSRLVYEQTIQTLRNWDTIFANWASGVIVTGGLGFAASLVGKTLDASKSISPKLPFLVIVWVLALVGIGYLGYSSQVARPKQVLLGQIEKDLHIMGPYRDMEEIALGVVKKYISCLLCLAILATVTICWFYP